MLQFRKRLQHQPEHTAQVLRFERPGSASPPRLSHIANDRADTAANSPVDDVARYERPPNEPDDYRHRQIVNAAGFAVCILLVVVGVWLADRIAEMRRDQDCFLSGRRNCAEISIIGHAGR